MSTYEDQYRSLADKAAKKYGIPEGLFALSIGEKNPSWNPFAVNPDGSGGIAGLMPDESSNPFDPSIAFDYAAKQLSDKINSNAVVGNAAIRGNDTLPDGTKNVEVNRVMFDLFNGIWTEKQTVNVPAGYKGEDAQAEIKKDSRSVTDKVMADIGKNISGFFKNTGLSLLVGTVALIIIFATVYKFVTE
jgi:hypothetical protein